MTGKPDPNFYDLGDEMEICPCGMPVGECESRSPEPEKSAEQIELEAKERLRLQRLDSLLLNLKDWRKRHNRPESCPTSGDRMLNVRTQATSEEIALACNDLVEEFIAEEQGK